MYKDMAVYYQKHRKSTQSIYIGNSWFGCWRNYVRLMCGHVEVRKSSLCYMPIRIVIFL